MEKIQVIEPEANHNFEQVYKEWKILLEKQLIAEEAIEEASKI